MTKIKRINRDGNNYIMVVEHENKQRERFYYQRVEHTQGVDFIQTGKEAVR